tara:strand:- start:112 stop:522 length:411 start_codon:yes stop_codon:yes gene_type:complete
MADIQIKTVTDAFAYILIYVAGVDGELSEEEAQINGSILAEFINHFNIDNDGDGDSDIDDLKSTLERSVNTYFSCENLDERVVILSSCIDFIKETMDEQTCKAIIERLRTMTGADGVIDEREEGTVDVIEEIMLKK